MNILRSTLFFIFQTFYTIFFGTLAGVIYILPFKWRWKVIIQWPRGMVWAAKHILGIRYEVKGAEHIPEHAAIYLSKHQSAWETLFIPVYLKQSSTFVYKKELNYVPFFGWGLASLRQISIDRNAGKDAMVQVIEIGSKYLKENRNVILFPEGTRVAVGQKGRYKQGGARLAVHTGSAVIPIAHNAGLCWPRQAYIKKPGLVTVWFGPPIESAGKTPEELNKEVEFWIESKVHELNPDIHPAPEGYQGAAQASTHAKDASAPNNVINKTSTDDKSLVATTISSTNAATANTNDATDTTDNTVHADISSEQTGQ